MNCRSTTGGRSPNMRPPERSTIPTTRRRRRSSARRHVLLVDPPPDFVERGKAEKGTPVYRVLWGHERMERRREAPRLGRPRPAARDPACRRSYSGRYDECTPELAEAAQRGIPGAERVLFEESSHMAFVEEPDRFREVLTDFLESRGVALTPRRVRWLATATVLTLYVIVITGSLVRLTGSGLGCEGWPGCEEGAFFPEDDAHAFIEFGNRVFGIFPITALDPDRLGGELTSALDCSGRRSAWAAAGRSPRRRSGWRRSATTSPPEIVMVALPRRALALARRVVVAGRGDPRGARRGARSSSRDELAARSRRPRCCCLGLVVTGTLVTAGGPALGRPGRRSTDSGTCGRDLYLHVRITAVFGCVFLFVPRLHPAPALARSAPLPLRAPAARACCSRR